MLTIAGTARFVSDLHLKAERPDILARFGRFLDDCVAHHVDAVFILGDLFEYWIGDDDLEDAFNARVVALLRDVADRGIALHFQAGNRDFLIGPRFAAAAGLSLLDEAVKVGVGDTAILVQHGDLLCTDDLPYQQFRRQVRAADWQRSFLARPLAARRAEVAELRRRSAEAMKGKTAEIMDVNPEAVRAALMAADCHVLIHGHTHRPGCEILSLQGVRCERWTLSDWESGRGDAIEIGEPGIRRLDYRA